MISNRKGLAFTSKTPGKTSEFNYFDALGKTAGTKENHRFYLVDLPGVGYAEVRKELRQSWLDLLNAYVTKRSTLRVLFHLVDSRHGLLDADEECLSLLPTLPEHVQYVIILTKVDKRGGGVRRDILDRLTREISKRTGRHVPIVYTSSETREGGAEVWSILLDAVAGEPSEKFFSRERVDSGYDSVSATAAEVEVEVKEDK
jgi:GTP-binding protein